MIRVTSRRAVLAALLGLSGCGGGIKEGFPDLSAGMTPDQKRVLDEHTAREEQEARDAASRKRPGRKRTDSQGR